MSRYKILLTGIILLSLMTQIFAQSRKANMAFENANHDFGKIKEEDGDVRYSFVFKNTGAEPIIINNVKSSCGCTTPNWTNKPVRAGETGNINVVYHTKGRPGNFHKSITVYSNAENSPTVLKISGNVIPRPKKPEEEYRYLIDKIRFKRRNIHFANIYNDETRTETVEFLNISQEPVELSVTTKTAKPKHLSVTISPKVVAPGQKGTMTIKYDAAAQGDWDYVRDDFLLDVNGKYDSRYRISVSATIKERFTKEDLLNPPAITFITPQLYEFGNITKGDVVEHTFKFKNTGKSDLKIRKVRASCGCTGAVTGKKVLKPGEEGTVKAVFRSASKKGAQRNTITMITNIPGQTNKRDNYRVIFTMKGNVNPKKK